MAAVRCRRNKKEKIMADDIKKKYEEANEFYLNKQYDKAFPLFEGLAGNGYAPAQNKLGNCYFFGLGTEKDTTKAVELFTKAAQQGYTTAQCTLAFCYYDGEGIKQDLHKAAEWWRKAAEDKEVTIEDDEDALPLEKKGTSVVSGDPAAQYCLGMCYNSGEGVEQDFYQASEWLWLAAEQGYALALTQLGVYYEKGILYDEDDLRGVPEDEAKAAMQRKAAGLYRKAAEGGHDEAQFYLGDCYLNGRGVEQDDKQAAEWFKKAAEQGHLQAKDALENLDD
jgi:TPR repeat protein